MKFDVEGMTCGHCVRAITKAIHALQPAARVDVDLASGTVSIDGDIEPAFAAAAIETEGYRVVGSQAAAETACCGSCR